MLDYTKGNLIGIDRDRLKSNKLLIFKGVFESRSGEITPCRMEIDKEGNVKPIFKEIAFYNGIKFIDFSDGVIQIEFTPHKYYNICNGLDNQNFNDFGIDELNWVLCDLCKKFDIRPSNIKLRFAEIGVNLVDIGFPINDIIDSCLLHKKKPFVLKKDDQYGHYISAEYDDYELKIYDKGKHNRALGFEVGEVLRIELKFKKLRKLKAKEIYTMQDLLSYGLENFRKELITEWVNVLYYDSTLNSKDTRLLEYSNVNYWKGIVSKGNENKWKHHKNELVRLNEKYSEKWQSKIGDLINDKINILMRITPNLHHFKKDKLKSDYTQFTPLLEVNEKTSNTPKLHYSNSGCKLGVLGTEKENVNEAKNAEKINELLTYQEQKNLIAEHNRIAVLKYNSQYKN